jgi:CheY-specific phosphatase CheX
MVPQRLKDTFSTCLTQFFADTCSCKVEVKEVQDIQISSNESVVSLIGYSGDAAKGTLLVVARAEGLKQSHPMTAMGADVSASDLNDWSGEIANQILGRIKNALLPYGVTIALAIPSTVTGSHLDVSRPPGSAWLPVAVRSDTGLVFGFALSIAFAPGFDLKTFDQAKGNEAKKEGDGILF